MNDSIDTIAPFDSYSAVIDAFGGAAAFRDATGIPDGHARTMKGRNSIPPFYWPQVVRGARERAIEGVTYELLAKLSRRRPGRPRSDGPSEFQNVG